MNLDSSNPPIYLPQQDQTSVLRLGFESCPAHDWLFSAIDLDIFHQHKTALGQSMSDSVYAQLPESTEAQREFHDTLLERLLANPALGYRRLGEKLLHPQYDLCWELGEKNLWTASLWVPEDICLLQQHNKQTILSAASVCSPSNWKLKEKAGQSVDFIHAPVPDYDSVLSEKVNRFLTGLRSGRVMLRYNWSLQRGNALYWQEPMGAAVQPFASNTESIYWRIERQTFLRLPVSGAIVFAIRIFLHSLDSLRDIPGCTESLRQLLAQLPAAEKDYKDLAQN